MTDPAQSEVIALRAQVERLKIELHAMTVDRNLWQDDHNDDCPYLAEVAELREQVRWKPITPDSMAEDGDEVAAWGKDIGRCILLSAQWEMSYETLMDYGYTHYRPINPPAAKSRASPQVATSPRLPLLPEIVKRSVSEQR